MGLTKRHRIAAIKDQHLPRFQSICTNSLGRDAVKEELDKVILQNTAKSPDEPGGKSASIENRALIIRESLYGYSDKLFGKSDTKKAVEDIL